MISRRKFLSFVPIGFVSLFYAKGANGVGEEGLNYPAKKIIPGPLTEEKRIPMADPLIWSEKVFFDPMEEYGRACFVPGGIEDNLVPDFLMEDARRVLPSNTCCQLRMSFEYYATEKGVVKDRWAMCWYYDPKVYDHNRRTTQVIICYPWVWHPNLGCYIRGFFT